MTISSILTVRWSTASDPFATSPTWVDITSVVQEVTIGRDASGFFGLATPATCTIRLDNTAGTVDPTVWYRWRQVQVLVTTNAEPDRPIYSGFVKATTTEYGNPTAQASATIECEDLLSVLARYEWSATSVPEETSGTRVNRVADAVGVPASWQSFATGYHYLEQPHDSQGVFGADGTVTQEDVPGYIRRNALEHLQDCAECELGFLYVDRTGILTFSDRYQLRTNIEAGALVLFSDTAGLYYLATEPLRLAPPGTDYYNSVTFTGSTGSAQTATNVPAGYPTDSLSRTLPMRYDNQALANAEALVKVHSQSSVIWPEAIRVFGWPAHDDNLNVATDLDLHGCISVAFTPYGKTQQTYLAFVDRIEHHITPDSWVTTLGLSSADRWNNAWGSSAGFTFGKVADRVETVSTTSGTATFTDATANGFDIGRYVYGTNIPNGTTVTNIVGTTVTMSANATATGSTTVTYGTFDPHLYSLIGSKQLAY